MTCIIDGSHMRVTEFDTAIVTYAVTRYGFRLDAEETEVYERGVADGRELVSDLTVEDCEALTWLAEAAVDWCCDHDSVVTFHVEDSCFWGETDEEWASEQQAAYDDRWR